MAPPIAYPGRLASLARIVNVVTDLVVIARLLTWIIVGSLSWIWVLGLWMAVGILSVSSLYLNYRLLRSFRLSLWGISSLPERSLLFAVPVTAIVCIVMAPDYQLFGLGTLFVYLVFLGFSWRAGRRQTSGLH